MHYLAALTFSLGLSLAVLQSSVSASGNAFEARCSTEEILEEHRREVQGHSRSLLALDAGRLGRQKQAQNPIRGNLGIEGGTRFERSFFNPDNVGIPESTTMEGIVFYPLNQPSQVDVIATTTKAPAPLKPISTAQNKTSKTKKSKKKKVPMLKKAKKLTKKDKKARKKAAKNCELSDWSAWSTCRQKEDDLSKLYYTTRYRVVITPRKPGGKRCNVTEEYMPCPQESSFRADFNLEDAVAGMGENASTEYGEPADEEDKGESEAFQLTAGDDSMSSPGVPSPM